MQWSLLESLDEAEQSAVLEASRARTFGKNEIVFHEGDTSDSIHLVSSGHFAVMVSTPDGDLATLNVLGPGHWFGELSMLREQIPTRRSATIKSLDVSQTLVLTQSAFHRLCEAHPEVERLVVNLMAARIRKLSADLLEARYLDLDRRLCGKLLDLLRVFDDKSAGSVIPLRQDQLAEMVGATRPSINQVLHRLTLEGIVEVGRGKVTVLDELELAVKAGQ